MNIGLKNVSLHYFIKTIRDVMFFKRSFTKIYLNFSDEKLVL